MSDRAELLRRASAIRLLVLDVDGVLTDGLLHYGRDGEALKSFHVRDGAGLKAVRAAGVEVAVISGRNSAAAAIRLAELGLRHVLLGREDKLAAFREVLALTRRSASECACVGDDTPDIAVMQAVALAVAVADAHPGVQAAAHHVTSLKGGHGAVREVCDLLLAARTASGD